MQQQKIGVADSKEGKKSQLQNAQNRQITVSKSAILIKSDYLGSHDLI
jgi:hypothetical protein